MKIFVSESGQGKYTQKINTGNHVLTGDEPVDVGGNDAGPSPYEFLLAALGTCTSITLRMYADLKKIPLKQVSVQLEYEKIHAKDCEGFENQDARIDHITRIIDLEGDLSEEQREKLLEIANKCPVHRTLTSKIIITTALVK